MGIQINEKIEKARRLAMTRSLTDVQISAGIRELKTRNTP